MKKQALALTAALLVGTMAAPASAFIWAESDIEKLKIVWIEEDVKIFKFIYVEAEMDNEPANAAAEASAYVNVTNILNFVNPANNFEEFTDRDALISSSVNENDGITGVNQDLGDNNNQANVVALAYTANANIPITEVVEGETVQLPLGGIVHAQAGTDQLNHINNVSPNEVFNEAIFNPFSQILNSVNGNEGITQVNQNAGHMNNQTNSAAVAAAEEPIVALSNADLGQVNAANSLNALGTVKSSVIRDSVSNNNGITQVSQASGHMNNQASAVSVAAALGAASVTNAIGNTP